MSNEMIYSDFKLPDWFQGPDDLVLLLKNAWNCRYKELYESRDDGKTVCRLSDSLNNILPKLWGENGEIGHKRFVFAGLALCMAAEHTIKEWDKNDTRPETVFDYVDKWLQGSLGHEEINLSKTFPRSYTVSQGYDEAIDALYNLTRLLNPVQSKEALLEILDDCLEGFAVFPGSARRRDLFNWVLIEVIPAAWYLRLPDKTYS